MALSRSFRAALALFKPLIAVEFEFLIFRISGFSMGASAVQLAKRALVALLTAFAVQFQIVLSWSIERELMRTRADAARYINRTYDVEELRSSFPERLEKLRKRRGDRLTEH